MLKDAVPTPCRLPEKPLDVASYFHGKLVALEEATLGEGWKLVPNWKPEIPPGKRVGVRPGFVNVPALVAEKPGSTLRLKFTGKAVGIFVAAGPDAGTVEYSIDRGAFESRDLFTQWSPNLHIPWAQVLAADLEPGQHELTLRVSEKTSGKSRGHAVRIIHFLVN